MIHERPNFFILSGGPGAGKTTTLEALRRRGFQGVDEAARQVLREQAASGGNATHDGDRACYRDLCLERAAQAFEAVAERAAPVFFDRGIPEMLGYGDPPGAPPPARMTDAVARYRYARTVFVFPAWEAIYRHDEERKHTFAHAVEVRATIAETYGRCGYEAVEVPRLPVEERVRFILERIADGSALR
ncbi:MAG TPA: AAA family ATPase [Caulobacteraceae bacterium]|jgi:predicted ATPase|nr:AAA family ATPase [Caulobacteraceae bacterium]